MRSLHDIYLCVCLQVHIHLVCVCVSRARPDSAVTPSPFPFATFLASLRRCVGCQNVFILCTRVSYVYSHTLYCMLCIFSHASHLRNCKPTRLTLAPAIVANARRLGTGSSACTICILYIGGIPRMQAVTAPAACMRGIPPMCRMQMVHSEAPVPRRRALATIAAASASLVGLQLRRCEACENMHNMQ